MSDSAVILLIEDEIQIRRFVRTALEAEGHRVVECGMLAQSIPQVHETKPHLAILDLGLPDGDGIKFIRERALSRKYPFWFCLHARQRGRKSTPWMQARTII